MENNKIWELVVGKLNKSLATQEEAEFEKIKETDEAKRAFRQASQIHLKSSNSFLIRNIDKEKNWKYINNQISRHFQVRKLISHFSKYAAVFVLALAIGIIVASLYNFNFKEITNNRIELEWGQMSKMTLSDGTTVWLNAGAKLEYPTSFSKKTRTVYLNGEAQFKVVHDDRVPFEVITETGIIKVYGTTFNVKSYHDDSEMTVTLIEGKVAVENSNGKQLATLNPSQQIVINKKTGEASLKTVDTKFYSSWIEGKILLDNTKLSDLVKSLERWYNVEIDIVGDKVGDIEVSGTIVKGKPINLFLEIMERMYGIKYKLKTYNNRKDVITIYKN